MDLLDGCIYWLNSLYGYSIDELDNMLMDDFCQLCVGLFGRG